MNLTVTQLNDMPEGSKIVDSHGDVWTKGAVVWHTPETAPFTAEVIVRKWSPIRLFDPETHDRFEVMSDESAKPVREYAEEIPDVELPGMWERADFEGGQDEVRGPGWSPERMKEKRERFVETYGVGKEGIQRFLPTEAPTSFDLWWGRFWKNRTDTIQHTIAKGIARDAWEAGRKSRG